MPIAWRAPSLFMRVRRILFIDESDRLGLTGINIIMQPRAAQDEDHRVHEIGELYRHQQEQTEAAEAATQRKERPERQRDVLFGAGCGLLCFGLFPFSASAAMTNDQDGVATDSNSASFGGNEFDLTTRLLSLSFALLGLACVTLSCVVVARAKLRFALLGIFFPLLISIVVSCSTILRFSMADDVVNVLRHTHVISFDQEMHLERAVNDLFCDAQARKLCLSGDLSRAKSVFGIYTWQQMETTCARLHHREQGKPPRDLDPLTLIRDPSSEAMQWCGQYISNDDDLLAHASDSPYKQHRLEVLDQLLHALAWRQARVKLLMVLEWFALPALVAVIWWWKSPSAKIQAVASRHPEPIHVVV